MRDGLALLAAAAAALGAGRARASDKVAKATVHYRYVSRGEQRRGLCASFIRGIGADGAGPRAIVDGVIPPDGWREPFSRA
jgi:hypothetical protein